MSWMPRDPEGTVAQPLWHRDVWPVCYEFQLIYDPAGTLVRDACRWVATRLDVDPRDVHARPEVHWISYARYRQVMGRRALSFRNFASALVEPPILDAWIRAGRRGERDERRRVGRRREVPSYG